MTMESLHGNGLAVIPVLLGPLQILIGILPGLLLGLLVAIIGFFKPSSLKQFARLLWDQKLPVSVAVCGVGAVIWAGNWLWGRLGPAPAAAEATSQQWPMARGGPQRIGAVALAEGTGPSAGGLNWAHRSGEAFYSSPAVVGNRVYVASAKMGVLGQSGAIHCLDADSGALVWRGGPPGYRPTFSSPVIAGQRLVCGEGLHFTSDARVICLDLKPGSEGKVLWTFRTKSHVECTPIIHNNRVYVGAGDDGYYCLDMDGKELWHAPGEKYRDAETALVVHEGKVYAGLGIGGRALCVLDADSGREITRVTMPYPVFSPPSIAEGRLYLGMGNGDYVNDAETLRSKELERLGKKGATPAEIAAARAALAPGGEARCIDLATLKTLWTTKVPQTVLGCVAVAGQQLFFGCRDGSLYCLDRGSGAIVSKWDTQAPIATSPAVTDSHVYALNAAGLLLAVDRRTMQPAWQFTVGNAGLFVSSPVAGRGRIYVGSEQDGLVCIGSKATARSGASDAWAGHLGGPGRAGRADDSPPPTPGTFHWQYPADQDGQTQNTLVAAPPAVAGSALLVPLESGVRGQGSGVSTHPSPLTPPPSLSGLACLPAGATMGQTPPPRWVYRTAHGVRLSPAATKDLALVVDGKAGDLQRHLHGIAVADGAARWKRPVADGASGVFALVGQRILIQDQPRTITCLDLGGNSQWSRPAGPIEHPPAGHGAVVVVAEPGSVVALDAPTGMELWRAPLANAAVAGPAVVKGTIYLATAAALEARSLTDGQPVNGWKPEGGPASGDFHLGTTAITYINTAGELVMISRADGSVLRRVPGAVKGFAPLVARDTVLFIGDGMIRSLSLADRDGAAVKWMETDWLGTPATSMVLVGGNVYMGRSGWGVVRLGKAP